MRFVVRSRTGLLKSNFRFSFRSSSATLRACFIFAFASSCARSQVGPPQSTAIAAVSGSRAIALRRFEMARPVSGTCRYALPSVESSNGGVGLCVMPLSRMAIAPRVFSSSESGPVSISPRYCQEQFLFPSRIRTSEIQLGLLLIQTRPDNSAQTGELSVGRARIRRRPGSAGRTPRGFA